LEQVFKSHLDPVRMIAKITLTPFATFATDSVLVVVGSLFWVWGLAASKAVQNVIPNVIRYLSCLDYKIQSEVFSEVMYFTVECKSLEKRANQWVE
jgi:hypothetical protein